MYLHVVDIAQKRSDYSKVKPQATAGVRGRALDKREENGDRLGFGVWGWTRAVAGSQLDPQGFDLCVCFCSVHMCACICIYIYIYICTYIHTYIPTYVHRRSHSICTDMFSVSATQGREATQNPPHVMCHIVHATWNKNNLQRNINITKQSDKNE